MIRLTLLAAVSVALIAGCSNAQQDKERAAAQAKRDAAAKKKSGSIIGKTTQDIEKFDPDAGLTVVDSKIRATTPGLASLEAYGPMVHKAAELGVQQRVTHFNALNGRYPTYEEFMSQIVKNKQAPLRLPVLPYKMKYCYDEANHTIVVVEPQADDAAEPKAAE